MARKRHNHSALRQAQADAALQFNPQRRDLTSALADARTTRNTDIASAQVGAGALLQEIKRTRPQVVGDYASNAKIAQGFRGNLGKELAGLGPGGAPFAAAVAREQAGSNIMAGQERANTLGELAIRGVQARQGGVNDVANVRANYASNAAKIHSQLTGLGHDQALFIASELPKIRQQQQQAIRSATAAADAHRAAVDLHRSRTASIHKTRQKPLNTALNSFAASIAGIGKSTAKAFPKPKVTPAQSGSALSQIHLALGVVNQFKKPNYATLRRQFLTGYKPQNPGEVAIPKLSGAGPVPQTAIIQSAFDLAQRGKLSRASYDALYGVPVPAAWRPHFPKPHKTRVPSARSLQRIGRSALGY